MAKKLLQVTGHRGTVVVHMGDEYVCTLKGKTDATYYTGDMDDAFGTAAHMAGFFDVTDATRRAVKSYGAEACTKAYTIHTVYGEGAHSIQLSYDLGFLFTHVNQVDAAINAGRELSQLYREEQR